MKRAKMEEKLLWMAYGNSPTLFRTVSSPTPYGLPFFEIGVCNLATPYYLRTGKTTDFKFCRNIHRVDRKFGTNAHENVGNSSRGRSQGVPKIFRAPMYRAHGGIARSSLR